MTVLTLDAHFAPANYGRLDVTWRDDGQSLAAKIVTVVRPFSFSANLFKNSDIQVSNAEDVSLSYKKNSERKEGNFIAGGQK